jgi:uncharacterized repeat protein (TIGR01451 family)
MKVAFAVAALAAFAGAPAAAEIIAKQSIQKEIVAKSETGEVVRKLAPADRVTPGETVVYTLTYSNKGAEPVSDIVLVMPVPREVSFVEGSTTGSGAVAFSADGGASYVARGRLTVTENGETRAARGDEITHVRWTMTAPAAAGANGAVSFKAVVR